MSVVYSVWSASGIVLTFGIGVYWFKEAVSVGRCIGIAMIVGGVMVLYVSQEKDPALPKGADELSFSATQVVDYGSILK
jgi:drug/metabolite transporter (DMT)-like permease